MREADGDVREDGAFWGVGGGGRMSGDGGGFDGGVEREK